MPPICPQKDQLRAFVHGDLPDGLSGGIAAHLETCASCEDTVVALERQAPQLTGVLGPSPTTIEFQSEPQFHEVLEQVKTRFAPPLAAGAADQRNLDELVSQSTRLAAPVAAKATASKTASLPKAKELPRLGDYELLAKLGQGGMGAVYKARHVRLDKIVALKVLPKERTNDPQARARFEREMRAVGRVNHPNIVGALDARDIGGTTVLIMEYPAGLDVGEVVRRCAGVGAGVPALAGEVRAGVPALAGEVCAGVPALAGQPATPAQAKAGTPARGIPIPDACEIIRQAALGLEAIRENGLVHRDIKPSNLILTTIPAHFGREAGGASLPSPTGRGAAGEGAASEGGRQGTIKILDLGLALLQSGGMSGVAGGEMTSTSQIMGTVNYIAHRAGVRQPPRRYPRGHLRPRLHALQAVVRTGAFRRPGA